MMINKLDGVTPVNNLQNSHRVSAKESYYSAPDSINVSDEAMEAAQAYYLQQVADETPDVRSDLVAQIKEKIKDPNYLNPERLSATADRILASYGF